LIVQPRTGILITYAMGFIPKGASLYGCLEMAGNVWEWKYTLWD
jgi:iron(II)-dependent oxidoreductase